MGTQQTFTATGIPVGAITTFAGDLSIKENLEALNKEGWLLCDGAAYDTTTFAALFAAIGTANGGSANSFNVPDMAGRFLRGTMGSAANTDPDAAGRTAAAPGGNTGNKAGSLQKTATALPVNAWRLLNNGAHTHTCSHLNADMHMAWDGSTYSMARWCAPATTDTAGAHSHKLTGFDAVTTPVNMSLYFIIKANEPETPNGVTPCGGIIGYAGTLSSALQNWLKCDGAAYGTSLYPNLQSTILYNFGGDGKSVLNVPDLRGNFLRGTSHLTQRDPNASGRHELNTGGNAGDNIGSAQFYATKTPAALIAAAAGAHSHNIAKIPNAYHNAARGASGPMAYNCMVWNGGTTESTSNGEHTHAVLGGDKETRPENIYADFLIATDDIEQSAPPIGTVMSFGGDFTDPSVRDQLSDAGWLPCDGSMLRINSKYDALNKIIGTTFGEAVDKFAVPDLRGYFIRGALNIKLGAISASTTGTPGNAIITSTDGDHTHSMPNVPTDTHTIDVVLGVDLAENNTGKSPTSTNGDHTHAIEGGDPESRPVNVNVDYIIRYR